MVEWWNGGMVKLLRNGGIHKNRGKASLLGKAFLSFYPLRDFEAGATGETRQRLESRYECGARPPCWSEFQAKHEGNTSSPEQE